MASLETDAFLIAVRAALLAETEALPELAENNVSVWHHGANDPDEDIRNSIARGQGVAALIYDLGGDETGPDTDIITALAAVELYVSPTKRRASAGHRLGGEIRDAIMRSLHRHSTLRNTAAFFDTRVRGYEPLADPEFTAWRITLSRSIYLDP